MNGSILRVGAASAGAAFAVIAVLVSTGHLAGIDSYAARNLMPGGLPHDSRIPLIGHLLQYHGHHFDASQVVRVPATIVMSVALLAVGCAFLWRRGRREDVVLWLAAFAVGNVIVLVCKDEITKPAISAVRGGEVTRLYELDSSFPSGHAMRAVMLAVLFASLWPRLRWLLVLWAAGAVVSLEIDRIHTPSDIVGGLLLAAAIVLAVPLVRQRARGLHTGWRPRRTGTSPRLTRTG